MNTFDIILVTDTSVYPVWFRGTGAHRLATHLRCYGYSCLVIDFSSALSFNDWKTICQNSIGDNTKIVGFSTTWWPYRSPRIKKVVGNLNDFNNDSQYTFLTKGLTQSAVDGELGSWINEVKKLNKKTKILVGGPKVDFYRDIPADNFIVGFGETQIIDYLNQQGRIWPTFIDHDKNAANLSFNFKSSQILYTDNDFINPNDILTIEFTRGCKFKCNFCSYPLIGRKDVVEESLKHSDVIYEEFITNYEKWGVTKYWVADDTFNDSTEKLEIILAVIKRLPFKLEFRAYTRLDVMSFNFDQVSILKEIGLKQTWIGIDSFHPTASKVIGKGMKAEKKKELLYKIREVWKDDVYAEAGYILGLPGEDSAFAADVLNWFLEPGNPLDNLNFNPLRINPPHPRMLHTSRSDIDLNYEKYGYNIPDLEKFWEWTKDDNTDLDSFTKTSILSDSFNKRVKEAVVKNNVFHMSGISDPKTEYFDLLIKKLKSL